MRSAGFHDDGNNAGRVTAETHSCRSVAVLAARGRTGRTKDLLDRAIMSGTENGACGTKLEEESSAVKKQLKLMMTTLEDQRCKDKEMLKVLEQWKDEEKATQKAKIEEMRQILLLESDKLANMIGLLNDFLYHLQRLHSSAYIKEEKNQKLVNKLNRKLQQQKELILFQRDQIKRLTSNSPEPAGMCGLLLCKLHIIFISFTEKKAELKKQKCALRRSLMKELGLSLQTLLELLDDICMALNSVPEKKVEVKKQMSKSALRRNNIIKELWQLLVQDLCVELEDFSAELFCVLQKNKVEKKQQTPKRACWRSAIIKGLGPLLLLAVLEELEDFCIKVFCIKEKKTEEKKQMPNSSLRRSPILKELGSMLLQALLEELEDFCMKVFCTTEKKVEEQKQMPNIPLKRSHIQKELQPFSSEEGSKEEILAQRPEAVGISVNESATSPADSNAEWTDLSDLEENQQPKRLIRHSTEKEEEASQGGLIKDLEHLERLFAERPSKPQERVLSDINMWPKAEDSEKDDIDDNDDNDYNYSDSLEDNPPPTKPGFKEGRGCSTTKNPLMLIDCSDTEDKI
ncbi:zinc finger protein Dzip1-like isoform X1 [Arapaima gigas]